jgi:hypothetical protein
LQQKLQEHKKLVEDSTKAAEEQTTVHEAAGTSW